MPTVCVLGSNSFSGSDFIDLLLEQTDYNVVGISRSPEKSDLFLPYKKRKDLSRFQFHRMDISASFFVCDILDAIQPEYIINFAAQSEVAPSWQLPEQWFETNVLSLIEITNDLKHKQWLKKWVQVSTPEVYGSTEGYVNEDAPFNPSTPYAVSKAAADMFLSCLHKQYGFPVVTVRSANVYGAHQQLHKIIPRSFIYLKQGKKIPLHGGGNAVRSFVHIEDISRGELAIMERGEIGEAYHLSSVFPIAIRDLVKMICEETGNDFEASTELTEERSGQDDVYLMAIRKAGYGLGWKPMIALSEGISEVHHWVDDNWGRIQREPLEYVHKP